MHPHAGAPRPAEPRELLELRHIRLNGGTQSRASIDPATVETYADAYTAGAFLPPIVVYFDGEDYWLADGFHRVHAAERAELEEIEVEIRQGTQRDAILHSVGANAEHGLRRTRADKRRAVETLLRDPEWSTWSNRAIAEAAKVHHELVAQVRRDIGAPASTVQLADPPGARTGRDGKTYPAPNIDQVQRAVAAAPPPEGPRPVPSAPAPRPPAPVVETPRADAPAGAGVPLEVELQEEPAPAELPNNERAPFDAYWTPFATALACVRWLARTYELPVHLTAVEPAVGRGAWVDALHQVLPASVVDRCDVDPKAPGLGGLMLSEQGIATDWLGRGEANQIGWHRRLELGWGLCIGNRPYTGSLAAWVETSLERAPLVAYLERETITGTEGRLPWWLAHRPAWVCKVIPRPKWEGPGARSSADFGDSVLIVWTREPVTETRWDWIDASEAR
jgi:hypothetical protein